MLQRAQLLSFLFLSVSIACSSTTTPSDPPADGTPTETPSDESPSPGEKPGTKPGANPGEEGPNGSLDPVNAVEVFGDSLANGVPAVELTKLVKTPETYRGKKIETSGVVRANCTKKGCWMEVRPADEVDGEAITVRFKDYGFFVPLDSRGHEVRIQGAMTIDVMSPAAVAEAEAEGATVPNKNPDGSANVVTFIATGVEMRGRI